MSIYEKKSSVCVSIIRSLCFVFNENLKCQAEDGMFSIHLSILQFSSQEAVSMNCAIEPVALVHSSTRFLYINGGSNWKSSDGRVFGGSSLQDTLEKRISNIPSPAPLPASD